METIEQKQQLVTIPKEVAEAIGNVRNVLRPEFHSNIVSMTDWASMDEDFSEEFRRKISVFFKNNPHEYIRAIQEGYQVEKTQKEQILELHSVAVGIYEKQATMANAERVSVLKTVIKIMGWEVK